METCRICLQEENLVQVCECKDKVHLNCLNIWRHTRAQQSVALPLINNFRGVRSCEVCLRPYKLDSLQYKNSSIFRKYCFKVLLDLFIFFSILVGFYVFFGWIVPPLWRPDNETVLVKLANGVIWTHILIVLVVTVSSISKGCICIGFGAYECNSNDDGAIIIIIVFVVLGALVCFMFLLSEILQKRKMQYEAELYLLSQNELEQIFLS